MPSKVRTRIPDNPFALWLISARKASGLMQKELSEKLGFKVRQYEGGYSIPTVERALEVAKGLGEEGREGVELPPSVLEYLEETQKKRQFLKSGLTGLEKLTPLGKLLYIARTNAGRNGRELGQAIGCGVSFCRDVELGKTMVEKSDLEKLANELQCPEALESWIAAADEGKQWASFEKLNPIAKWVREVRIKHGWEQLTLAEAMKERKTFIKYLEGGRKVPSLEALERLSVFLDEPIPDEVVEALGEEAFKKYKAHTDRRSAETLSPFGKVLRAARLEKRIAAKALSLKLGRAPAFIARIERGCRHVPEKTLREIARGLGFETVPPSWRIALDEAGQRHAPITRLPESALSPLAIVLRRERHRRCLTQKEVAAKIGVIPESYSAIEYRKLAVNDEILGKLAKLYGFEEIPHEWFELRRESKLVPQYQKGFWPRTNAMMTPFGKYIRRRRDDAFMNQADLAKALNRSPEWVHELEYGRVPHYPELLLDVALALGLKGVPDEMIRAYDETVACSWI